MKFERIQKYPDAVLPQRGTEGSAGYDFCVAEDTMCYVNEVTYVPTGIKAQIDDGYYLQLSLRSSAPKKYGIILANGIGVVDSDYYNNPDNEGAIMFAVLPFNKTITLKKGERIGQGVFLPYAITDSDSAAGARMGGFGSTS